MAIELIGRNPNQLGVSHVANVLRGVMGSRCGDSDLIDWKRMAKEVLNEVFAKRESQPGTLMSIERSLGEVFDRALMGDIQVRFKPLAS